jgi:hypothetical protein
MGGTTLDVAVPQRGLVRELKQSIVAQVRTANVACAPGSVVHCTHLSPLTVVLFASCRAT